MTGTHDWYDRVPKVELHLHLEGAIPLAMFGNSLAGEYRELAASAGFTRDDVRRVLSNAVEASWLSPPRKAVLAARLSANPVWRDDS